tara:strand:- start:83 stop:778 length:696 start_codon:yes stop_codon:yes gene_type:complete
MKKVCKKCGVEKSLSDYKKYTAGKGGIRNVCVECERTRHRDWKRKNADRINEGRRERTANDPEYRERNIQYKREWRIDNREHHLKTEREGANRRYRENPEFREKCIQRANNYRHNRTDEQIERDRERHYQYWTDNKEKLVEYRTEWRHNRRKLCIEKLGGKCVQCGATERLQFDHIIPSEKSFNICYSYNLEKVFEELDKCQLLCPKCHLEKTKDDWLSGQLYKGIGEDRS